MCNGSKAVPSPQLPIHPQIKLSSFAFIIGTNVVPPLMSDGNVEIYIYDIFSRNTLSDFDTELLVLPVI